MEKPVLVWLCWTMAAQHNETPLAAKLGTPFRFGVIGVANNLLGYLIYLLVTNMGVDHKLAMSILYIVGASIGYVGNKKWTFKHQGRVLSSASRYALAHFFGYLLNLALLLFFVDGLGYRHEFVQGAAIFLVAVFLFLMFRYFVFREASNKP